MSRLRLRYIGGVLAVLALAVLVALLLYFGIGPSPPSEAPERSAPESSSSEPPVPEEPKPEMHTVVVEALLCRLDGAELSECEDVCKIIEKSSGPATLDAVAGSHKVVEELRRCLEEAGVEVRWGS